MRGGRRYRRWCGGVLCGAWLLLAAGCGDFFTKSGGGGGGGSTTGSYTYVGTLSGVLVGYSVSSSGTLATASSSQLSTSGINALGVTPNNSFLYAAVAGIGIYGLSINSSTGVPTLIQTTALVQDVAPLAMTVDPSGSYLLVAGLSNGAPAVGEYAINSDGTLSEVSGSPIAITFASGTDTSNATVNDIAVAPNSSYVFVSLGSFGVAPMPYTTAGALSANTILLNPRTTSGISNQDLGLAVNAASSALFVGETNAGVRVFTIAASSKFTELSGSPYTAGGQPRSLQLASSGDYLYAANVASNTVSGYSVSASGALTALTDSPYSSVGTQPYALALDQSGKYLIAANQGGSPDVQVFSFASSGGVLTAGSTATNATSPSAIASTH